MTELEQYKAATLSIVRDCEKQIQQIRKIRSDAIKVVEEIDRRNGNTQPKRPTPKKPNGTATKPTSKAVERLKEMIR